MLSRVLPLGAVLLAPGAAEIAGWG